ncbi:YWFCY domain-containing protein, partial [Cnuella takakiae]
SWFTKATSISLLFISLIGTKGKKQEGLHTGRLLAGMGLGCLLVWGSPYLTPTAIGSQYTAFCYMGITSCGYLLVLSYGSRLSRVIRHAIKSDIFNTWNESFPQEERLLQNDYSINLKATYQCRGKLRDSWVNIINPFRGILVLGSPGSGKTHFVIQQIIRQHIEKGFSMFVYDFKFDDLTQLTYECLSRNQHRYPVPPA